MKKTMMVVSAALASIVLLSDPAGAFSCSNNGRVSVL